MAITLEPISRTRPAHAGLCICAWCGATLKDRRAPKAAQPAMNYGMCARCLATQLERLETRGRPEPATAHCTAVAS